MFLVFLLLLPLAIKAEIDCCHSNFYIPDPSLCHDVVHCPTGQQCHIMKIQTGTGSSLYKMGCATSGSCPGPTEPPVLIGRRQLGGSGDCNACCNSRRCNVRCCNNSASLEACCAANGYKYLSDGNICIKLYTTPQTWPDAEQLCALDNAKLLMIRNSADYEAVKDTIMSKLANITVLSERCPSRNQIWIGANDIDNEGDFRWWNGHSFTAWQLKHLHADDSSCDGDRHSADCILIDMSNLNMWDRHCEYKLPFVCQKDK